MVQIKGNIQFKAIYRNHEIDSKINKVIKYYDPIRHTGGVVAIYK